MTTAFLLLVCSLVLGIAVIIVLTAVYRINAFFSLLIASILVGLCTGLPISEILIVVREGFGRLMQSLGLIIVLGVTLGALLEHSGATKVMAEVIIRRTGEKRAALAMGLTGFVVGLPVFCDSAYIVLSGLNQSLAKRTGTSMTIMAVSLAVGAYSVHCLIPPHPGAAAAATTLGVDFGTLILVGTGVAIPGMVAGHLWALYAGKKLPATPAPSEQIENRGAMPSALMAFLPVAVPIALIAIHSFLDLNSKAGLVQKIFAVAGEPVIALCVGIVLILATVKWTKHAIAKLLQEGAEKAGSILVVIGAGGAFGAVLAAAKIGDHFSHAMSLKTMGIFFPFLLTFILKTAQGSSTVAIITAASIVLPLLPSLGLDDADGKLLAVLSMGAGSMMISHGNDAYFWVISKFSGLDMKTMLKSYSVASIIMGLTTLLVVYILSLILL